MKYYVIFMGNFDDVNDNIGGLVYKMTIYEYR